MDFNILHFFINIKNLRLQLNIDLQISKLFIVSYFLYLASSLLPSYTAKIRFFNDLLIMDNSRLILLLLMVQFWGCWLFSNLEINDELFYCRNSSSLVSMLKKNQRPLNHYFTFMQILLLKGQYFKIYFKFEYVVDVKGY